MRQLSFFFKVSVIGISKKEKSTKKRDASGRTKVVEVVISFNQSSFKSRLSKQHYLFLIICLVSPYGSRDVFGLAAVITGRPNERAYVTTLSTSIQHSVLSGSQGM